MTFAAKAVRLQLYALAYNLGNFLGTLATPEPIKVWSLSSLKEKLIKIGAKVVSHGRYVAFQMAEVAIRGSSRNCGRSHHQRQREALRRSCVQRQPKGGVCPNARGKGQIRLPDCCPGAWNGGSSRHPTPVLRQGRKSESIHANSGVIIWGMPDQNLLIQSPDDSGEFIIDPTGFGTLSKMAAGLRRIRLLNAVIRRYLQVTAIKTSTYRQSTCSFNFLISGAACRCRRMGDLDERRGVRASESAFSPTYVTR